MSAEIQSDSRGGRLRRGLALIVAPLAVIPFIFVSRIGYLRMGGHTEKFWVDDVLYLTIVSYLGSAISSSMTVIVMKLRPGERSIRRVWAWFSAISVAIAALFGWASLRNPAAGVLFGIVTLIGATAVSLIYGLVAGLPWRAKSASN